MSDRDDDEMEDTSAPLIEHLAELRTRLIRSVLAFMVAITVFFIPVQGEFIATHVLEFMLGPIEATYRAAPGDADIRRQYARVLYELGNVWQANDVIAPRMRMRTLWK